MKDFTILLATKKVYLILSILMVLLLYAPTLADEQNNPSVEQIAQDVKQSVQELVKGSSVAIKKPEFYVDNETKKLSYSLGGVQVELLGLDYDDPYLLIYEKQLHIEALRKCYQDAGLEEAVWVTILQEADEIVKQAIRDIKTVKDINELRQKLDKRNDLFSEQLHKLKQALLDYAKANNLIPSRGDRFPASSGFSVEVSTAPQGGNVRLMPYLVYRKKLMLKVKKEEWPWRDIVTDVVDLIGNYYYEVKWPDGKIGEGMISVSSPNPICFKPKN